MNPPNVEKHPTGTKQRSPVEKPSAPKGPAARRVVPAPRSPKKLSKAAAAEIARLTNYQGGETTHAVRISTLDDNVVAILDPSC